MGCGHHCESCQNAQQKLQPKKLLYNKKLTENVFVLAFERTNDFVFVPGQVIALSLDEQESQHRIYSISSGARQKEVQIIYDIKQDGFLTPQLERLQAGDTICVTEPSGEFFGSTHPALWIATGTGVAPFASMMRSGLSKNKMLIHGGRKNENFYFQEEFREKLGDQYIRCASRDANAGDYSGRVTDWLKEQEELPQEQYYYICGRAEMVVEVRDLLIEKNIPYNNIIAEIYF